MQFDKRFCFFDNIEAYIRLGEKISCCFSSLLRNGGRHEKMEP